VALQTLACAYGPRLSPSQRVTGPAAKFFPAHTYAKNPGYTPPSAQSGPKTEAARHRSVLKWSMRNLVRKTTVLPSLFAISFLAVLLATTVARPASSPGADRPSGASTPVEHHLRLYHTHTGERIDIVYRRGNQYLPEAEEQLDHFLRDHRTGDVKHYDPHVFDLLSDLAAAVGHPGGEIDVICGYRSPWSNEFLRARSSGVAKNSLHVQAHAIDIRIPGVDTLTLRDAALKLGRGGVGYYPRSGFVHVDTGRVRTWCYGCSSTQTHRED
jgi:uncharacterized protein YcbK (DUF882 family)